MRYFKVTSLPKFRLKRRKFPTLTIRIKWVRIEKSGQNLGYDNNQLSWFLPQTGSSPVPLALPRRFSLIISKITNAQYSLSMRLLRCSSTQVRDFQCSSTKARVF
ncbi:hypothetical protein MTR_0497s0040 [Medicago truncatula]|uniref:Uncharacterized protein n=1 Tax=Medicago truncatula TaxID=3880 RepID=A0A072TF64_MEDTR|nr:hypothetical protein MTR_0497s0040 [Medicago truncatula]